MVIDGAKGVESQTQKLFEVCRMRDLPILTFCNKMDRESRDTFDIIDEIQQNLAIDVTPASWPIGRGREFIGTYDLLRDQLELMDRADRNKVSGSIKINGLDDPALAEHVPAELLKVFLEEIEMAKELLPKMDHQALLDGTYDPDLVRFGHQFLWCARIDAGASLILAQSHSRKGRNRVSSPQKR